MSAREFDPEPDRPQAAGRVSKAETALGSWRSFWLLLALIVAAGGLIRWTAAEMTHPVQLQGDEVYYAVVADRIARGWGHEHPPSGTRAWRPPAHAFVLSRVANTDLPLQPRTFHAQVQPMVRLQVALGTLLVLLTGLLARTLFDERTAVAAAGVAAVYPPLVAHSHYLWSETTFACFASAGLALAVSQRKRGTIAGAAATGVVFGFATLTREISAAIALAVVIWWILDGTPEERHRAKLRGAVLLACLVLTVLPWTLRNYRVLDRFVPVSTIGAYALAEGNTLDSPKWFDSIGPAGFAFRKQYFAIPDEMDRTDFARGWLVDRVGEEQPTWIFKKFALGVAQFFSPDSYLSYKLARGAYGDVSQGAIRWWMLIQGTMAVAIFAGALLGILSARHGGRRLLAGLVLGAVLGIHILANSGVRFRLPWMPFLISFAASGWFEVPARIRGLSPWERLGAAVGVILFVGLCVPFYWGDAVSLWLGEGG